MIETEKQQIKKDLTNKSLSGKRILVCGKGGSGKSSIVTLMAKVLETKKYKVLALDGDASNPEGLLRLMFGLREEQAPRALIEFFGGTETVTCPVDDPSPLTRLNDSIPIFQKPIDIDEEISSEYFIQKENTILFQTGKIKEYGQGCDGPTEKVTRDFIVNGEQVNLIDAKAGVEHFGRRMEDNIDVILTILDPTFESISIAKRVAGFCREMGTENFWFILNKIKSKDIEKIIINKLGELENRIIGAVRCDSEIIKAGLRGSLGKCNALEDVEMFVEKLEKISVI
ncbi:MAG: hypothetical protein U9P88_01315 [Patescibacteria group bacterium]|nr:hypothetical protein [Patescibacteria group bacterium]